MYWNTDVVRNAYMCIYKVVSPHKRTSDGHLYEPVIDYIITSDRYS